MIEYPVPHVGRIQVAATRPLEDMLIEDDAVRIAGSELCSDLIDGDHPVADTFWRSWMDRIVLSC